MKWFILLLAFAFLLSCNKKDDAPDDPASTLNPVQEQWGLVINYTAKWCGPCGSWGSLALQQLAGMGKVVAVTNHADDDPMYNPSLFSGMNFDRPVGPGIPSFWIGDIKSSEPPTMTALLERTPVAAIDMKTVRSGADFTITARVRFFSADSGDYHLSFWILESGIDGSPSAGSYAQNGNSDTTFKHDYVIRAAYENAVFGTKIVTDPAVGSILDKTATMTAEPSWNHEVYIVACLWKHDPSYFPRYKYINGFVYKD